MTPTLDPKALEAAWHASLTEYDASDLFKRMNAGWSAQQALERLMQDAVPAAVSAYLAALNETHALVPREASDSMTEAAQDAADDHFSIDADKGPWLRQDGYKAAWAAMIDAALTAQEPRT